MVNGQLVDRVGFRHRYRFRTDFVCILRHRHRQRHRTDSVCFFVIVNVFVQPLLFIQNFIVNLSPIC